MLRTNTKIETVKSLLNNEAIDLALGSTDPSMETSPLPSSFQRVKLKNFGTLHLYFNSTREIFKRESLRKDLAGLIRNAVRKIKNPGFFLEHQFQFIPKGIMPRNYYQKQEFRLTPSVFRNKWINKVKGRELHVFLREYLHPAVVSSMDQDLREAGFFPKIQILRVEEMIPYLQTLDYDMVLMGYFGACSDPDCFLDPLNEDAKILRYGVFPSRSLFSELEQARFIPSNPKRLQAYTDILEKFESQSYFVSLFRFYLPVVVRKEIELPDVNYRFDILLSHLFWKETREP